MFFMWCNPKALVDEGTAYDAANSLFVNTKLVMKNSNVLCFGDVMRVIFIEYTSVMIKLPVIIFSSLCLVSCQSHTSERRQISTIPKLSADRPVIDTEIVEQLITAYQQEYSDDSMVKEETDSSVEITFYNKGSKHEEWPYWLTVAYIAKKEKTGGGNDTLLHGDIDGDGRDEIIYTVHTEGGGGGGNMEWDDIFVFKKINDKHKLISHQA